MDILVEVEPSIVLRFVTLAERLEELLGQRVDLVSRRAIKPSLWRKIASELMPERDSDLLLPNRIERYTAGFSREQFLQDDKTIDAVVRNLEIIGEAMRRLPADFKKRHCMVRWSQIAGRNRIVHDYFELDLEIIWEVLSTSLSQFKQQLASLRG